MATVIRVLIYEGEESWVRSTLERNGVKGFIKPGPHGYIYEIVGGPDAALSPMLPRVTVEMTISDRQHLIQVVEAWADEERAALRAQVLDEARQRSPHYRTDQ